MNLNLFKLIAQQCQEQKIKSGNQKLLNSMIQIGPFNNMRKAEVNLNKVT